MNWTHRNRIVAQQLERDGRSPISPIGLNDWTLYRHFFAADQRMACYGNSWAYITQACRGFGLGLKYHDGDTLISIGHHRGHYVVVRPLGTLDWRVIELLQVLYTVSGKPVFIKKLFPDQVDILCHLDSFDHTVQYAPSGQPKPGAYPWDPVAFADDDTYPEVIVNTVNLTNYSLTPTDWFITFHLAETDSFHSAPAQRLRRHYGKFRRKVKQFLKLGICCRLVEYRAEMAEIAREFLYDYFGPQRRRDVTAYENLLKHCVSHAQKDIFLAWLAYMDGESFPCAFSLAERLDAQSAGQYVSVASREYPGLSEYLKAKECARLHKAGIKLLNLGGSETKNIHIFKHKLAPVEERFMTMLVYGTQSTSEQMLFE